MTILKQASYPRLRLYFFLSGRAALKFGYILTLNDIGDVTETPDQQGSETVADQGKVSAHSH
jgi:hypothetical protein